MLRERHDDQPGDRSSDDLIELHESMNVVDQTAQSLVASVRVLLEHRARYEPVDASSFLGRDIGYYDRTRDELRALGFDLLGDFEDAASVTDPSTKTFVRFALGAHGAIAAMWFDVPAAEPRQCLVFHSWLDSGHVFVTARGTIDNGLPLPQHITVQTLGAEVDTKSAVRMHGERVAASGRTPRRLTGVVDLFEGYALDETQTAEFREAQGAALFESMLRTMLGDQYEEQGRPIVEAIERHPEWLRGELSPGGTAMRVSALRAGDVNTDRFPNLVIARIPEHIGPVDRGERYEDPLQDALAIRDLGAVTGGGSQVTETTEIDFVDVELLLADLDEALAVSRRILEEAGAPVGSRFLFEKDGVETELAFGAMEGLSLYLDGVSLPAEVYEQLDIHGFVEQLAKATESVGGEPRATWDGPTESAFHHFGPSADAMLNAIRPLIDTHPICQNARIVLRQGPHGATRTIRVPMRGAA